MKNKEWLKNKLKENKTKTVLIVPYRRNEEIKFESFIPDLVNIVYDSDLPEVPSDYGREHLDESIDRIFDIHLKLNYWSQDFDGILLGRYNICCNTAKAIHPYARNKTVVLYNELPRPKNWAQAWGDGIKRSHIRTLEQLGYTAFVRWEDEHLSKQSLEKMFRGESVHLPPNKHYI